MEIRPDIHQVDGVNGNSSFIRNGLVIIDTGIPGSGKTIFSYIQNNLRHKPDEIRTVILTHFHTGHVSFRDLKKAAPGLNVAVHEAEAGYVCGKTPHPRFPGFRELLLHLFAALMPSTVAVVVPSKKRPDGGLTCIHIPRHTPGSIGLLDGEAKTLFAGDLFRWDGTSLAEGHTGLRWICRYHGSLYRR